MADPQALQEDLERAINDVLATHRELPTKWILALESLGSDGENGVWCFTSAKITAWDALGLLEYARVVEIANMQMQPD